ncbi:hypothetical protein ABMA28_002882 [Loxostege sticticalis]|uniref:Gustatory receptor n=1 Tax=Loxostege sticticalis TaxID=481309 RepID=A0ABD0SYB8_LOXSC
MDETKVGQNKQNESEDAFDSLNFINQLLKIFCLSILSRENRRLKISYSWFKVFFTIVCIICLIIFLTYDIVKFYAYEIQHFKFNDEVLLVILVRAVLYSIDLCYVFKFGGNTNLHYFKLYEQIDKVLDTDNAMIKTKVLKVTVFITSLYGILTVVNIIWAAFYDPTESFTTVRATVGIIMIYINSLSILEMLVHVILIEYRLIKINNILQLRCSSTTNNFGALSVLGENNWLYFSKHKEITRNPQVDCNYFYDISWLNKCYLLLIEQSNFINKLFGVRILLNSIINLWDLVNNINFSIRISFRELDPETTILNILSSTLNISSVAAILICLIYRCEKTYEQRRSIINVVDRILVEKYINVSMRSRLAEFRTLVYSRPIQFTAAHFYRLDYTLLVTFCSAVTTYSIILLQYLQ